MLQETNKALTSLRDQNKIVAIKKARRKYFYKLYKKYLIQVIFILLILWVFLCPIQAGTIFGTWIHDFFVTIYLIVFQSVR